MELFEWFLENSENEATEKRNSEEERRLADYVDRLLDDPEGRHFLFWLVNASGYFRTAYPKDHAQAAFTEGSRAVGAVLFALILKSEKRAKFFLEDK